MANLIQQTLTEVYAEFRTSEQDGEYGDVILDLLNDIFESCGEFDEDAVNDVNFQIESLIEDIGKLQTKLASALAAKLIKA